MEIELQNFDLEQIAASGQCFRMCSTVNGGICRDCPTKGFITRE